MAIPFKVQHTSTIYHLTQPILGIYLKKIKAYVHTKKVLHIIMTTFLVEKEVKKEETLNVNVITLYIKLFYYYHF